MAAKGSKSRRGNAKPPLKPDAEPHPADSAPEGPTSEVAGEAPSAVPEERNVVAESEGEPMAAHEAQSPDAEVDAPPEEWRPQAQDAPPPNEPEGGEAPAAPGNGDRPAPRRHSYGVAAGVVALVVMVGLVGLAGAWFYGTVGDPERLDEHTRRLDQMAGQAEAHAGRLDAAEEAVTDLQSEVGQLREAVSGVETSLNQLQAAAEANRQSLARLAEAVESLRGAATVPSDGTVAGEAVAELRGSVETLGERLAGLEQGDHLSDITASLAQLEEEVADLREQAVGRIEQAQAATALGRAHAALAERVAAGAPFADELEAVTAHLPTAPGVDALRPHAGDGVATVPALRARLGEIADRLPREETEEAAPADGVWQTIRDRLQGMVTVRRTSEPEWSQILAEADAALGRGDIAAAVAAIEGAPEAASDELAAWLDEARARRDVEAGLDELSAAVLRQFAGRR